MNVLYETACEHLISRNPENVQLDDVFRCRTCNTDTTIIGVQLMEYRAKCRQCPWTRYTGMSSYMAALAGNHHSKKNYHFNVDVGWAVNPAARKERERIEKGKLL